MTGPKPQPQWVASEGIGDLKPGEAVARCKFRAICCPGPPPEPGDGVPVDGCVVLLGPPTRLPDGLIQRIWANVSLGKTFVVATERKDTMRHVLEVVDKMGGLVALEAAPVAGNA